MEATGHVCLASIMTRHNSLLPVVKPGDHKPSTGARLRPKTFSLVSDRGNPWVNFADLHPYPPKYRTRCHGYGFQRVWVTGPMDPAVLAWVAG
jgi:hypothetical protein